MTGELRQDRAFLRSGVARKAPFAPALRNPTPKGVVGIAQSGAGASGTGRLEAQDCAGIARNCDAVLDLRRDIDIEELLVWTYRQQKADLIVERGEGMAEAEASIDGVESYAVSGDGVAAIARIARLGVRVDGGGPSAGHLHEDAERVHRAVMALSRPIAHMLMRHARLATRPDWMPGAVPKPSPRFNGRGQAVVSYEPSDKHRNFGVCMLSWSPTLHRIDAARAEYALWHDALRSLAVTLVRRLGRHRPRAPSAPPRPWVANDNGA